MAEPSERTINRLQHLPNELFELICSYLNGPEVIRAFSKLNARFDRLLAHRGFPLRFVFDEIHFPPPGSDSCEQLLLPHVEQLVALHVAESSVAENFIRQGLFDQPLTRLKSLVLPVIPSEELQRVVQKLGSASALESLIIQFDTDASLDLRNIYSLLFSCKSLKFFTIDQSIVTGSKVILPDTPPPAGWTSAIQSLSIGHPITTKQLLWILRYTPSIRRLHCSTILDCPDEQQLGDLPHLKHLAIEENDLPFPAFQLLMDKIGRAAKTLRIGHIAERSYLNADRWRILINERMKNLRKFYLQFTHFKGSDASQVESLIHQCVSSSFWTERHWSCSRNSTADQVTVTIRSPPPLILRSIFDRFLSYALLRFSFFSHLI